MKNSSSVIGFVALLVIPGCTHKEPEHMESQEYVDALCRAAVSSPHLTLPRTYSCSISVLVVT